MNASSVQRKEFNYNLGDVKLGFTLRTDVKVELKAFKELLERALEDIVKELDGMKEVGGIGGKGGDVIIKKGSTGIAVPGKGGKGDLENGKDGVVREL